MTIIRNITHKSDVLVNDKLYKIINLYFVDDIEKLRVEQSELINIEIVSESAFDEDGNIIRNDNSIPINLGEVRYKREQNIIMIRFENGQTDFNDGARLILTIKQDAEPCSETLVFKLEDQKWAPVKTDYEKPII